MSAFKTWCHLEKKATSQHVKDHSKNIKVIMRFSVFSWLESTSPAKSPETQQLTATDAEIDP